MTKQDPKVHIVIAILFGLTLPLSSAAFDPGDSVIKKVKVDSDARVGADAVNKTSGEIKTDAVGKSADEIRADLETKANKAFWERDFRAAKNVVDKLLKEDDISKNFEARCLVNRAICESQLDEDDEAHDDSAEAYKLSADKSLTEGDAAAILARGLLQENKYDKARALYTKAIEDISAVQGTWNGDLAPFYEGLAGCYLQEKNYQQAEDQYRKVAQLDLLKYGPDDTHLAWSLMSLASCERILGRSELAERLYKKVFWNFRHQNELRIIEEHKTEPDQEAFINNLRHHLYGSSGAYGNRESGLDFIKEGIPANVLSVQPSVRPKTFENWFKERVGREKAPGFAYFDPNKPLKGLIVTVHGLGLYGGAYSAYGEKIQHEGYGLISFDVRGFGSYRNDEVMQKLDLQASLSDIKRILTELRSDYPDTPILLLGESMGGAIVLRIASESPSLVDAVISSVPSGSRYQGKRTALKVALKFLHHKHEQFDIGSAVVRQATVDADLRDMWEGDSQMRMKLSPAELLNFQTFMGENVKAAAKITDTPVIIFQGFSDNLVKPMGTLAIYQAIPTKDKDMVFIGHAEHLIFEEGQFDDVIFKGALEWINRHAERRVRTSSPTKTKP
jgi:alpha-beta hydrolase superfamily lysophospholipase